MKTLFKVLFLIVWAGSAWAQTTPPKPPPPKLAATGQATPNDRILFWDPIGKEYRSAPRDTVWLSGPGTNPGQPGSGVPPQPTSISVTQAGTNRLSVGLPAVQNMAVLLEYTTDTLLTTWNRLEPLTNTTFIGGLGPGTRYWVRGRYRDVRTNVVGPWRTGTDVTAGTCGLATAPLSQLVQTDATACRLNIQAAGLEPNVKFEVLYQNNVFVGGFTNRQVASGWHKFIITAQTNRACARVDSVSITCAAPTSPLPAAPSNFVATARVGGGYDFAISDNANNETSLQVQYSTEPPEAASRQWLDFITKGANTTAFTDVGSTLTPGLNHWFRARTSNQAGQSDWTFSNRARDLRACGIDFSVNADPTLCAVTLSVTGNLPARIQREIVWGSQSQVASSVVKSVQTGTYAFSVVASATPECTKSGSVTINCQTTPTETYTKLAKPSQVALDSATTSTIRLTFRDNAVGEEKTVGYLYQNGVYMRAIEIPAQQGGIVRVTISSLLSDQEYSIHLNAISPDADATNDYNSGLEPASPTLVKLRTLAPPTNAVRLAKPAAPTMQPGGQDYTSLAINFVYPEAPTLKRFRATVYKGTLFIKQQFVGASMRTAVIDQLPESSRTQIFAIRLVAESTQGITLDSEESESLLASTLNVPDGGGGEVRTDLQAPSRVLNLTASGQTTTSALLNWSPATDNVAVTAYKIYRGSEPVNSVTATSYSITNLPPVGTYQYRVVAVDADGNEGPASDPITLSACQPTTQAVGDMAWVGTPVNGWGPVERNKANGENGAGDGGTLCVNGVSGTSGLGVHSNSEITFNLGGLYTRFTAQVGVACTRTANLIYQVWIDGTKMYESPVMTNQGAPASVDVDVSNGQMMKLVCIKPQGLGGGHGGWLNAQLTRVCSQNDLSAPAAPRPMVADSITATTAVLRWTVPADNFGISSYEVYRATQRVATTTTNRLRLTGLTASTPYLYQVIARDAAGNASLRSAQIALSTANPDGTPNSQIGYPEYDGPDYSWVFRADPEGLVRRDIGSFSDDGNPNNDWDKSGPNYGRVTHYYMNLVQGSGEYTFSDLTYDTWRWGDWFIPEGYPTSPSSAQLRFAPYEGMDYTVPVTWTGKPANTTSIVVQYKKTWDDNAVFQDLATLASSTNAYTHTIGWQRDEDGCKCWTNRNNAHTYRVKFVTSTGDVYSNIAKARHAGAFPDPKNTVPGAMVPIWKKGWIINNEKFIHREPLTNINLANYRSQGDVLVKVVYTGDTISGNIGNYYDRWRGAFTQLVHLKTDPSLRTQPATPVAGSGQIKVEKLHRPAWFRLSPFTSTYVGDSLFPNFQPSTVKLNVFEGYTKVDDKTWSMTRKGWSHAGWRSEIGPSIPGRVARFQGDGWTEHKGREFFGAQWDGWDENTRHARSLIDRPKEQLYEAWLTSNVQGFNVTMNDLETIANATGRNDVQQKLYWVFDKWNREVRPPNCLWGWWSGGSYGWPIGSYELEGGESTRARWNGHYTLPADQVPAEALGSYVNRDLDPNTPGNQSVASLIPLAYPRLYSSDLAGNISAWTAQSMEGNRRKMPGQKVLASTWQVAEAITGNPIGRMFPADVSVLRADGKVERNRAPSNYPYSHGGGGGNYADPVTPQYALGAAIFGNVTGDGISPWDCNCVINPPRYLWVEHTGQYRDYLWLGLYQLYGQDERVRRVMEGGVYGDLMEVSRDDVTWTIAYPANTVIDKLPMARLVTFEGKAVIATHDESWIGGSVHDIWVRPIGAAWKAKLSVDGAMPNVFFADSLTPL